MQGKTSSVIDVSMANNFVKTHVIGIDVGGTKLAVGVADNSGHLLASGRIPTDPAGGSKSALERLVKLCKQTISESAVPVLAAGVGSVGPLDQKTGRILSPVNMPGWGVVPLVETLSDSLGIPVYLDNDANAAALGEYRFGAGRGVEDMVYLTISTGIGGGAILDGKVYQGASGNAAELGHVSIDYNGRPCGCGNMGCIEQYASGTAIARRTREALTAAGATAKTSPLIASAGSIEAVNTLTLLEGVRNDDPLSVKVWDETVLLLGAFMASVIHTFNPRRIVLGGGVTNAGDLLFVPLREQTRRRAIPQMMDIVDIVPAQLGDQVGVLGAVAVGQDGIQQSV
jgi:glucokinase